MVWPHGVAAQMSSWPKQSWLDTAFHLSTCYWRTRILASWLGSREYLPQFFFSSLFEITVGLCISSVKIHTGARSMAFDMSRSPSSATALIRSHWSSSHCAKMSSMSFRSCVFVQFWQIIASTFSAQSLAKQIFSAVICLVNFRTFRNCPNTTSFKHNVFQPHRLSNTTSFKHNVHRPAKNRTRAILKGVSFCSLLAFEVCVLALPS